jgi:hypothetical protein
MASHRITQKDFNIKQQAMNDNLGPNLVAYKVPEQEFETLSAPKIAYDAAYLVGNEDLKDTRNHNQVKQLTDATDTYKYLLAHIEAAWVKHNPFIPNSVKIDMHCHINDDVRHKHPGPSSIPVPGQLDFNIPRHVGMHYRDSETPDKTAKPDADDVCEAWVYVNMGDGATVIFNYRFESSKDSISIPFTDAEAGKEAIIRLCWKNKKGRGEFSADIKVVIPQ